MRRVPPLLLLALLMALSGCSNRASCGPPTWTDEGQTWTSCSDNKSRALRYRLPATEPGHFQHAAGTRVKFACVVDGAVSREVELDITAPEVSNRLKGGMDDFFAFTNDTCGWNLSLADEK